MHISYTMLNMSSSSASSASSSSPSPSPSTSPPPGSVTSKKRGVRSSSNSPAVIVNQSMKRFGSPTIETLPDGNETHFSCAYKNNGLFHGKLCISKTSFSFKSITGFSIVIQCVDVIRCMKRNTAFVFPKYNLLNTFIYLLFIYF